MSLATPDRVQKLADGVTRFLIYPWGVCLFREPDAGNLPVRLCVQRRLACSAGDKPAGARVRGPV